MSTNVQIENVSYADADSLSNDNLLSLGILLFNSEQNLTNFKFYLVCRKFANELIEFKHVEKSKLLIINYLLLCN